MLSMVEFDVEALFEIGRKTSNRRRCALHVRMTDGAHRYQGSKKLLSMAVHAGPVTRKQWSGRIVRGQLMTVCAAKRSMTLARVFERRVVEFRTLHRLSEFRLAGAQHRDTEDTEAAQRKCNIRETRHD